MLTLLKPLAIEDLQVQLGISIGERSIARVDFASPSRMLVIEVDGWRYHRTYLDMQRDSTRERKLTLAGWRVLRFTWDDVVDAPDVVVRDVQQALSAFAV